MEKRTLDAVSYWQRSKDILGFFYFGQSAF